MANNNYEMTYCNPLPMPDHPQGSEGDSFGNYRDLADPTVLWHEQKWILFGTTGAVYLSEDYRHWKSCQGNGIPALSAPTVVKHRGRFYLMGSESPVYEADSPLGPFSEIGKVRDPEGRELYIRDPMLFSDEDERLYLYWGLGPDGIKGMELCGDFPCRGISCPVSLFGFDPEHSWERLGNWNQNRGLSFIEGAWMHKHNGRYYLIYSASGTCYSTYAWGVYQSDSPLEGFVYQEKNPVLRKTYGLVSGTGHGSLVEGPCGTLWAFYTIRMCYAAKYERRIAMDPAGFDEKGNLFVCEASEFPQWAPGVFKNPGKGNGTSLMPLTFGEQAAASSHAPGRDALYALDESMLTWWEPMDGDTRGTLTVDLRGTFLISAARIIWRDVNLDYSRHILPGPFQYLVEACDEEEPEHFTIILDCSSNDMDYSVDYRVFSSVPARYVRLTLTGGPSGIKPGVVSFTVFGEKI